ncbi:MAG: glycerophosphodiester phosphodiesterase family protein [Cellulosilyticaceae bacterium]
MYTNDKRHRRLVRNTFINFRQNVVAMFFFEIVYKLLALMLIIPLNYYILNRSILKTGSYHITNKDLVAFGLTLPGIVSISLVVLISFIAIFIEMAILTYMANASHKGQQVNLLEAAINCVRLIPRKLSIYMVFIVLLVSVLGPLTGVGLCNSLIKELSIPSFIKIELFKSMGGKIVFGAFMAGIFLIVLRWLLAIPSMIIEETDLRGAFRRGRQIYQQSRFGIMLYLVWWGIVNYLIKFILLLGYVSIVGGVIISFGVYSQQLAQGLIWCALGVFLIGFTILSMITLPLFISFLVELYYDYGSEEMKLRTFDPIDKYENTRLYKGFVMYRKTMISLVIGLFGVMVGVMGWQAVNNNVLEKEIAITAHRGSSLRAPENSLSSIKYAIEEGADYAEIDVMSTVDGQVVLFHDSTLSRIDGTNRKIKDMTLEEAKQVNNGSYFSAQFASERIPSLEEVLGLSKGKIKLNIELKPYGTADPLARQVAALIKANDMEKDVVVSSLSYEAIDDFRKELPLVSVGYIMSFGFGDLTKLDVDFVSVEYSMLSKELVSAMNALGKEVHVWTINDPERAVDVARMRVDNVITDDTQMVHHTFEGMKREDIHLLTWFYEGIAAILKYVRV